jgi:hypothetical protein
MKKGTAFHESETHPKYARDLKTFDENRGIVFHKLKIHPKNARGLKTSNEKRGTAFHKLEMKAAQSPPPPPQQKRLHVTQPRNIPKTLSRGSIPLRKESAFLFLKTFAGRCFLAATNRNVALHCQSIRCIKTSHANHNFPHEGDIVNIPHEGESVAFD